MTAQNGKDQRPTRDALWASFVEPEDAARPRVWWHWMDGNIDPAGVVRDLTWLHGAGIRGVQLFDGGMGVPLVVPELVRPGSAAWTESVDTAVHTADDLGLELAVATSPGWSAAGGPWVRPEDAMKKIVWSETVVEGGVRVEALLAPLPSVAGLYQDSCRWGGTDPDPFAVDWVVLAVPYDARLDVLKPATVSASGAFDEWECLVDDSFDASLSLPRDPDGWSTAWVEQHFDEAVTVRSVVVGLPGPRGFGAAPSPEALLQASDDGVIYRDVARLDPTAVPARSASFAPVTARRFRLVVSGGSAADALPPVTDGVRLPPVLRRSDTFLITEFALRTAGRVDHAETKAGFGVVPNFYDVETDARAETGAVDVAQVVHLGHLVEEGVLRWNAPPGHWRIIRFGASLTGQTNGPALADSTGLEVDKLDGARVAAYLKSHLARFGDPTDAAESSRFSALLSDSIESGPQNWTDCILEQFVFRRGYDPLPWLPALAGYLVGNASESDRFLFDYRRTLAELFADEYYGTLSAEAHRRGMVYYAEALEDGRPQLGDDLAMRSHADVPMGAMWTFDPEDGPRPTYVADLKGASSVAHVYGKSWVGSEAFTSFGKPWSWSPQTLKHVADLQFSLGVTRFCIHTSPHQPLSAPPPGIALAPFLGQAFTINETWSDMARPWIDYLARCSALLSAGRPAVDIAVFIGEEAPVTGLFNDALDTTVPAGFDFDYVGADALADILRVQDSQLVSDGASYQLLYLGGSTRRMTTAALAQIQRLVDSGATVVGIRPDASPSLADDSETFRQMCDRLWATGGVISQDLETALRALDIRPAIEIEGGPVRRIGRLLDGRRITFLANPSADEVPLRLTPSDAAHLVGWDPVHVRQVRLPLDATRNPDRPVFTTTLAPFGSLFVLEGTDPAPEPTTTRISLDGTWRLHVPGGEPIDTSPGPQLWTDSGEGNGFSGTAIYHHEFTLTAADAATIGFLELEFVGDIARVVLNDQDCGVLWTPPFRVDVSTAIRPGTNGLQIHVATPWRNRLIAEANHSTGKIFAPMTAVFDASATPTPAGIRGHVALLLAR